MIGVIGLGLIGGSILRGVAARAGAGSAGGAGNGHGGGHGGGGEVIGFDADPEVRAAARSEGFNVADSWREVVDASELVFFATPIADTVDLIGEIANLGASAPVLTDVSSVKRPVMHAANEAGLKRFVGGHPMAGSHRAGWAAADEGLLRGAVWALVLDEQTDSGAWANVAETVLGLGARVAPVSAVAHDRAVAAVSHAAHVASAAYANSIEAVAPMPLSLVLAAGSFRDVTRVMLSPEERTAAMLMENGDDTAAVASVMSEEVLALAEALSARDEGVVAKQLASAGDLRRRYDRLIATEAMTGRLIDAPNRAELVDELRGLVDTGALVADITDVVNDGAIWRAAVLSPV